MANKEVILVKQPSAAPTRKWKYGAIGSALISAVVAGLQVYRPDLAAVWGPVIFSLAGGLGFAIPAYLTHNAV